MTVRLRAHHLLCVLTYAGYGYSPAFIKNYDSIVKRLVQGEEIVLVEGPDDICAPLLNTEAPHCLQQSALKRDAQAAAAIAKLLHCQIAAGVKLTLSTLRLNALRAAFSQGKCWAACVGCEWSDLCTTVASANFKGTRLYAKS